MKVLITGGTGFVGAKIVDGLVGAGHEVRALVRRQSAAGAGSLPGGVEIATGDILDSDLDKHLDGVGCVVHLVGIIRAYPSRGVTFEKLHVEATSNLVRAMESAGVKRLVHMSALGAGPDASTDYFRTKWAAESAVRESGLDWSVIKPSAIYGPGDEFVNMLAGQVRLMPVVPVIGDGAYRLQPISVKNVAEGFVKACSMDETIGKVYEAGGPDEFTYNDLLDEIARAQGKAGARKIHFPLSIMQPLIKIMERFDFFPVTTGQLDMLLMNNVCDPGPFFSAFDIKPISFPEGIGEYISR